MYAAERSLVGVFEDPGQAEQAIKESCRSGLGLDQIEADIHQESLPDEPDDFDQLT
jgi:hypothetical protein